MFNIKHITKSITLPYTKGKSSNLYTNSFSYYKFSQNFSHDNNLSKQLRIV